MRKAGILKSKDEGKFVIFELNVETPGYERGRIWAWGWDGAEARALKVTLALEHT